MSVLIILLLVFKMQIWRGGMHTLPDVFNQMDKAAFALNRSAGAREMATSALKFGKSKIQGGFFKPRHVAGQEDGPQSFGFL